MTQITLKTLTALITLGVRTISIGANGVAVRMLDGSCRQYAPARDALALYGAAWTALADAGFIADVGMQRNSRMLKFTPFVAGLVEAADLHNAQ